MTDPVSTSDKDMLKKAFMQMKGGEIELGMQAMAKVFLGWSHISEPEKPGDPGFDIEGGEL